MPLRSIVLGRTKRLAELGDRLLVELVPARELCPELARRLRAGASPPPRPAGSARPSVTDSVISDRDGDVDTAAGSCRASGRRAGRSPPRARSTRLFVGAACDVPRADEHDDDDGDRGRDGRTGRARAPGTSVGSCPPLWRLSSACAGRIAGRFSVRAGDVRVARAERAPRPRSRGRRDAARCSRCRSSAGGSRPTSRPTSSSRGGCRRAAGRARRSRRRRSARRSTSRSSSPSRA